MAKAEYTVLGTDMPRMGGVERVVGKGIYGIDLNLPDASERRRAPERACPCEDRQHRHQRGQGHPRRARGGDGGGCAGRALRPVLHRPLHPRQGQGPLHGRPGGGRGRGQPGPGQGGPQEDQGHLRAAAGGGGSGRDHAGVGPHHPRGHAAAEEPAGRRQGQERLRLRGGEHRRRREGHGRSRRGGGRGLRDPHDPSPVPGAAHRRGPARGGRPPHGLGQRPGALPGAHRSRQPGGTAPEQRTRHLHRHRRRLRRQGQRRHLQRRAGAYLRTPGAHRQAAGDDRPGQGRGDHLHHHPLRLQDLDQERRQEGRYAGGAPGQGGVRRRRLLGLRQSGRRPLHPDGRRLVPTAQHPHGRLHGLHQQAGMRSGARSGRTPGHVCHGIPHGFPRREAGHGPHRVPPEERTREGRRHRRRSQAA